MISRTVDLSCLELGSVFDVDPRSIATCCRGLGQWPPMMNPVKVGEMTAKVNQTRQAGVLVASGACFPDRWHASGVKSPALWYGRSSLRQQLDNIAHTYALFGLRLACVFVLPLLSLLELR